MLKLNGFAIDKFPKDVAEKLHVAGSGNTVLRITTRITSSGDLALFVEGKLAGACVSELERCWHCCVAGESPGPAVVDLTEVSFIDFQGKQLLTQMHAQGIKLVANGLMSKFMVEEIERGKH